MNELLGVAMALFSTLAAALVSGLRLKPYLDAGAVYTPPTFALYPALIATAVTVPAVVIFFWWRRKVTVTIGPATFTDRQFFAILWSLLYMSTALIFFPYQPPTHEEVPKNPLQPVVLRAALPEKTEPSCTLFQRTRFRSLSVPAALPKKAGQARHSPPTTRRERLAVSEKKGLSWQTIFRA